VFQIQLSKSRDTLPLTRDYMREFEAGQPNADSPPTELRSA